VESRASTRFCACRGVSDSLGEHGIGRRSVTGSAMALFYARGIAWGLCRLNKLTQIGKLHLHRLDGFNHIRRFAVRLALSELIRSRLRCSQLLAHLGKPPLRRAIITKKGLMMAVTNFM
jgi:hypothetical protein